MHEVVKTITKIIIMTIMWNKSESESKKKEDLIEKKIIKNKKRYIKREKLILVQNRWRKN